MKKKKIIYIVVLFLLWQISYTVVMNINLNMTNEEFITKLLSNATSANIYENNNWLNRVIKTFSNVDLKKPSTIINTFFETNITSKYINYQLNNEIKDPLIYIYNSDQLDSFNTKDYAIYGITPNTLMASYLLQGELNKLGISSIVETTNIEEYILKEDITKKEAINKLVNSTLKKYPNIKIIIDIKRGEISELVKLNNRKYAPVLFVIGTKNEKYQKNLKLTNKVNNTLVKYYPSISKGVLQEVNKSYNQNINDKIIVLKIGDSKSSINEVNNTITILAPILKESL